MSTSIYSDEYKKNHRCPTRIYRKIWCEHHGEKVPKGYHIHHLDGDCWNNDPNNLLCTTPSVHYWVHWWQGDLCVRFWGTGKWHPHNEETRKKISDALKGKRLSRESIRKSIATKRRNGSLNHSPEVCEKISKARKGMIFSEEHKRNLSAAQTGRPRSEESKRLQAESMRRVLVGVERTAKQKESLEKMQKGNLGRVQSQDEKDRRGESLRGHIVTAETREKISATQRGRKLSESHKEKLRAAWVLRRQRQIKKN